MRKLQKYFMLFFTLLITSCISNHKIELPEDRKFNPGHYIALNSGDITEINYLDEPAIIGVNKRYNWRDLEPEKGIYDFSEIEDDLIYLKTLNKQLIVFIIDKSHWRGALPSYLSDYEIQVLETEYGVLRWKPELVKRYIALGEAIGKHFDNDSNFEGVAIQESALGLSDEILDNSDYTPEKYRDALMSILVGVQQGMPHSNVFWYSNFMYKNNGHLRQVADSIEEEFVFMGGPDILPYRRWISSQSYPMYEEYKNKLILFCSAQDDSYMHHENDFKQGENGNIPDTGFISMENIFLFARDSLHVNYLFWNYFYEETYPGVRNFDDAYEVIKKYPTFNLNE
jgi:hypothetical protein